MQIHLFGFFWTPILFLLFNPQSDEKCLLPDNSHLHGKFRTKQEVFRYPERIQLTCNPGYWLPRSRSLLQCDNNGQWKPFPMTCDRMFCLIPNDVQNRPGRNFPSTKVFVNATIQYRCEPGYKISNENSSSTQRCIANNSLVGVWDPPLSKCARISCGNLSNPDLGWVQTESTLFGSMANYKCQKGYRPTVTTRYCLANGEWSGRHVECKGTEQMFQETVSKICRYIKHSQVVFSQHRLCSTPMIQEERNSKQMFEHE